MDKSPADRLREALGSRHESYRYVLVDRDDLKAYLDSHRIDPAWSAQEIERLRHAVEVQMAVSAERATTLEQLQRIDQAARAFVNSVPEAMTFRGAQSRFNALCDALFDGRPPDER